MSLKTLIQLLGVAQLFVLVASALVPIRLDWKREFEKLSVLHRQMYWVYGGYVVLGIVALGLVCLVNARELAEGGPLARSVACYGLIFWGVRVALQPILKVDEFLTRRWLRAGYHLLTVLFLGFVTGYAYLLFR